MLAAMQWWSVVGVGVAGAVVVATAVAWLRARTQTGHARREAAVAAARAEAEARRSAGAEARVADLQARCDRLQDDLGQRGAELAESRALLDAERRTTEDKLAVLHRAQDALKEQFRLLAGEVLEGSAKRLQGTHHESLAQLLTPLKERIDRFETQVRETYDREARDRVALRTELQRLSELGLRMSSDASNLTRALKGEAKTRGDWGELVLETLLERSGLERGREYRTQASYATADGGRLRPDVVVDLPEGRCLVVDSKVSLGAWTAYCDAVDDAEQERAGKALVQAVRGHVRDLAGKGYHDLPGGGSPDFVLMFVPIEPAFALACQRDPQLFQQAFDQHVVIVSPTTLLATLRTVANIWRYERQSRHALEIARVAGAMYDKFVNFLADLDHIGDRLRQTQQAHDAAVNKLKTGRGNLISTAERVRRLGAKTAKKLGNAWTAAIEEEDAADEGGAPAAEETSPPEDR